MNVVFLAFLIMITAELVALGLHALQHRGQTQLGSLLQNGEKFFAHRGIGQVSSFSDKKIFGHLKKLSIGHNRYGTTGSRHLKMCSLYFLN